MKPDVWIDATHWPYGICVTNEDEAASFFTLPVGEAQPETMKDMWPKELTKKLNGGCTVVLPERFIQWHLIRLPAPAGKKDEQALLESYLKYHGNNTEDRAMAFDVFNLAEEESSQKVYNVATVEKEFLCRIIRAMGLSAKKTRFIPESVLRFLQYGAHLETNTPYRLPCTEEDAWCFKVHDRLLILGSGSGAALPEAVRIQAVAGLQAVTGVFYDLLTAEEPAAYVRWQVPPSADLKRWTFALDDSPFRPNVRADLWRPHRRLILAAILLFIIPAGVLFGLHTYAKDLDQKVSLLKMNNSQAERSSSNTVVLRPTYSRLFALVKELETETLHITYRQADSDSVLLQGEAQTMPDVVNFALEVEKKNLCMRLIIQELSHQAETEAVTFELVCEYEKGGVGA